VPAYAADTMTFGTGTVTSIAMYGSTPIFYVNGLGVFFPDPSGQTVMGGWLDTGRIRFGTIVPKLVRSLEVRGEATYPDTISLAIVTDDGETPVGAVPAAGGSIVPTTAVGERLYGVTRTLEDVSVKITLDPIMYPAVPLKLTRWNLKAAVAPRRSELIVLPVVLHDMVTVGGSATQMVPVEAWDEYAFLRGLVQSGEVVIYQEGSRREQVKVENIQLEGHKLSRDNDAVQGVCTVVMRTV